MQFSEMGRDQLRKACKEAGIKYGNMKAAEMVTALEADQALKAMGAEFDEAFDHIDTLEVEMLGEPGMGTTNAVDLALMNAALEACDPLAKALQQGAQLSELIAAQAEAEGLVFTPLTAIGPEGGAGQSIPFEEGPAYTPVVHPASYYIDLASRMDLKALGLDGIEGHCPHCGIHLSNGVLTQDEWEHQVCEKFQIFCLACNGEWGPPLAEDKPSEAEQKPAIGSTMKIEMVRPRRNGVARPSAGGKCRAVWDECDRIRESGVNPLPKMLKEWAAANGQNESNAVIEMYNWRKYNGITGRQK